MSGTMADPRSPKPIRGFAPLKPALDLLIPLVAWTYFTLGWVFFFAPVYLGLVLTAGDKETACQRLLHRFFRVFFKLLEAGAPGLRIQVDSEAGAIRSSVVVSNHISYLDPILFIALFPRHKTIVKSSLFRIPIFGRVLRRAGYLPAAPEAGLEETMIDGVSNLKPFLERGGNIFVFPEGTRRRQGEGIGSFNPGAFKIARRTGAPVAVLRIRNTHHLFPPGRFRFNTCVANTIRMERVGTLDPGEYGSVSELMTAARTLMAGEAP